MAITIGDLARQAGLGIQTLRFYEREGLLYPPARNNSGYRVYEEAAIARLRFIRRAQELGFALKEIRELLALQENDSADCAAVRSAAEEKLQSIEARIADLNRMKETLSGLVASCHGVGPAAQCEIIHCLAECN